VEVVEVIQGFGVGWEPLLSTAKKTVQLFFKNFLELHTESTKKHGGKKRIPDFGNRKPERERAALLLIVILSYELALSEVEREGSLDLPC
jgi:hypothetical protein